MNERISVRTLLPWWTVMVLLVLVLFNYSYGITAKLLLGVAIFCVLSRAFDVPKALVGLVLFYSVVQITLTVQPLIGMYGLVIGTCDVVVLLMLLFIIAFRTTHPRFRLRQDPFAAPLAMMLLGSLISLVAAENIIAALSFIALMLLGYVFYRFIVHCFAGDADIDFLVFTVAAALALTVGFGAFTMINSPVGTAPSGILLERLSFVFTGPNGLGAIIVTTIPVCVILISRRNPYLKLTATVLIVAAILLLLPTYSRNGYVSLLICTVFMAFALFKRKAVLIISLLVLMLIGATAIFPEVLQRTLSLGYFKYDLSALGRLILWRIALTDFLAFPLTGIGLANFWHTSLNIPLSGFCHNLYLSAFAETGIVGGLGLLWLIAAIFVRLGKAIKSARRHSLRIAMICLTGSWLAFAVHNTVDQAWFFVDRTYEMKFFWFFLGLTAVVVDRGRSPDG